MFCNRINLINVRKNVQLSYTTILSRYMSDETIDLKTVMAKKIIDHQKLVKNFRSVYGNKVIGAITVDQVYGGMRGIKSLVTETSFVDPEEGIRFRGHTIPEIRQKIPSAKDCNEPLPEGLLWLLLTGDIPTVEEVKSVSNILADHADLPSHVATMINNFPSNLHPMSQFAAAIVACNTESIFVKAYADGCHKSTYWEYTYDDAIRLIAKLPPIAAAIYRNLYREGSSIGSISQSKDWTANFATMLGYNDPSFIEMMRLFLTIHCDHEGGNVTAHATHLMGSALSDPYLSFGAGMCGLSGPLHGLASQEVLIWLNKLRQQLGDNATDEQIKTYVENELKSGHVVPGYGHAVLRNTDPRYIVQRDFALKHLPDDPLFKMVSQLYKIVPQLLLSLGKVRNPWPNVDAHSGVLLQHYGMKEMNFYTVLVGVSRSIGVMSSLIWDRALGLPIERPQSMTTEGLQKLVGAL